MLMLSPRVVSALLVLALAVPAQDDKKAQEEASKKAVEDFKKAVAETKAVHEKALLIQKFGDLWPKESSMVAPVAKFLAPGPGDINYILPVTAAEALGKYRGSAQASQALMGALPMYKKIPYVYDKILLAVGKVGHESSLTFFEEPLKTLDKKQAGAAVDSVSEMPPHIAIDWLFKKAEEYEKKKEKAADDQKAGYDAVLAEVLRGIKKVSGQPYPTLTELKIWWTKRGKAWQDEAAAKEKESLAKRAETAAAGGKTTLTPPLIVELLFKENGGQKTVNSGTSGGMYFEASISAKSPAWSGSAPPNGGPSSLDWGAMGMPQAAVDLGMGAPLEHLKNLKSFTICGWLNCKSEKETAGDKHVPAGNRIVSWLNHGKDGVELVHRPDGNLQLGINEWAANSPAASAPRQIPLVDEKATDAAQAFTRNWKFFAVTFDSTAAAGQVKWYFGTAQADAKLDKACDYPKGAVGAKIAPALTVGNVAVVSRPMAPDRCFKGHIDQVRIFGSTMDGSGALPVAELIKVQDRQTAVP
jgi:hypothetical protein